MRKAIARRLKVCVAIAQEGHTLTTRTHAQVAQLLLTKALVLPTPTAHARMRLSAARQPIETTISSQAVQQPIRTAAAVQALLALILRHLRPLAVLCLQVAAALAVAVAVEVAASAAEVEVLVVAEAVVAVNGASGRISKNLYRVIHTLILYSNENIWKIYACRLTFV